MKTSNIRLGIGTGSGTTLSVLGFIGTQDVLKTVALAAVGAVVSFAVSWVLQHLKKSPGRPVTRGFF